MCDILILPSCDDYSFNYRVPSAPVSHRPLGTTSQLPIGHYRTDDENRPGRPTVTRKGFAFLRTPFLSHIFSARNSEVCGRSLKLSAPKE